MRDKERVVLREGTHARGQQKRDRDQRPIATSRRMHTLPCLLARTCQPPPARPPARTHARVLAREYSAACSYHRVNLCREPRTHT